MIDRREVKRQVKNFIKINECDLTQKFPRGFNTNMASKLNTPVYEVNLALKNIRKETGLKIIKPGPNVISTSNISDFQKYCLQNKIVRTTPSMEAVACNKITNALINILPRGGIGMIIGTPTAFCACPSSNNNLFITDNFEVAVMLKWTTDYPNTIIVGNAIDPKKAQLKAEHWKSNNSTNKSNVILDKVDSKSYIQYVTDLAKQNGLCKVILMTSGVWSYCKRTKYKYKKKYGNIDMNFEKPSVHLTALYPNLHILAMTTETCKYGFGVRYLNNGKNELL